MNTLFLIGNGFDLAHGHKTKYIDFIYWYLNSVVEKHNQSNFRKDELIEINSQSSRMNIRIDNSQSILEFNNNYRPVHAHSFVGKIISKSMDANWVDIEEEYYLQLKTVANTYKIRKDYGPDYANEIKILNNSFEALKMKLIEYLNGIQGDFTKSESLEKIIKNEQSRSLPSSIRTKGTNLFLNFNYTNLISSYIESNHLTSNTFINIHGVLDNPGSIIFGYGDEIDAYYEEIENLNNNEFLKHIKSFDYLKTDNYGSLINFIKSGLDYKVVILGHSCGISDRVLLNTIFESENCKEIKIYYYAWEGGNDFTEKTQNISRHFHKDKKEKMREKIVSFEKSSPLR